MAGDSPEVVHDRDPRDPRNLHLSILLEMTDTLPQETTPVEETPTSSHGEVQLPEVEPDPVRETQEDVKDTASPPSKKDAVPPKRPLAGTKRLSAASSATSSVPKPHQSTTARAVPGSGLSKPPTRPATGSAVRRPASGTASGPTAGIGHRSQASTSSTDDSKKTLTSGPPKRASLAGAGAASTRSPAPTSKPAPTPTTERRSAVTPAGSAARRPPPASTTSPAKVGASKLAGGAAPTGTGRSAITSTKLAATGAVAEAKKRLSTIAGSPSAASRISAKPSPGPVGSAKENVALKERVKELEAEVQLSKARTVEANGEANGGASEENASLVEDLKSQIENRESTVSRPAASIKPF
jgi:hypothetical protein